MQSRIVTGELGKKFAALKISSTSRKRYWALPIEFISDTEADEKGMLQILCIYLVLFALFSATHVHISTQACIYAIEIDSENDM